MFNNVPALTDTYAPVRLVACGGLYANDILVFRLSSICLSRFMLNLRSISLSRRPLGPNSLSSLFSSIKFSSCRYAGNAGAPVSTRPYRMEDDDDFLGLDEDELREIHEVSDDPLMTGIVGEVER